MRSIAVTDIERLALQYRAMEEEGATAMSDRSSERVLWLLAGLGVGAGVAMLFAPQSGRETRSYIKKLAEQGKEKLADGTGDIIGKGSQVLERGKTVVDEAMDFVERGRRIFVR